MKTLPFLNKKELTDVNGGTLMMIMPPGHHRITIMDWDPNIGWEGEGPGGVDILPI